MSSDEVWVLVDPLPRDHIVQLYSDETLLVEALSMFAGYGLVRGEAVVLVTTPAHREAVQRSLEAGGFHGFQTDGQLTFLDAQELLSSFMVAGMPDATLFQTAVGDILHRVKAEGRWPKIRAFGEMVDILWKDNLPAALRLEELWNEAIKAHSLSLFCAYSLEGFDRDGQRDFPQTLRAAHSHVIQAVDLLPSV